MAEAGDATRSCSTSTGRCAELVSGGNLDRERCLTVGDTPVDVEAAHGAGIRIVGVATGEYDAEALRAAGADHVLATLEEPLPP